MQDQENKKDVRCEGKVHQEVAQDEHSGGRTAQFADECGSGQSQKEHEPKKIESSINKLARIRRPSLKCSQRALIRYGAETHQSD